MPPPPLRAAHAADFSWSQPRRRLRASCQDRGVTRVRITVAGMRFEARLETEQAPKTCAKFVTMLPLKTRLVQARWSGEAAWIPLAALDVPLRYQNHPTYPPPHHLLL